MTGDDLRFLASLATVRRLNLDETSVSDDGLALLSGLASLRYVGLRDSRVTEDGFRALERRVPGLATNVDWETKRQLEFIDRMIAPVATPFFPEGESRPSTGKEPAGGPRAGGK